MTKPRTRLLVVSDLHAVLRPEQRAESHLLFEEGISEYGESFINFCQRLNKDIDALVCPGDISNRADTASFVAGWEFLNSVKDRLSADHLFCVPGNHDHQSRQSSGVFDPKHHLQFVNPSFPFSAAEKNTQFWAWHWCHSEIDGCGVNLISLNSSAYHGFADEHHHGRVATEVIDQISAFVSSSRFVRKNFNLLLCHHHPEKMEHVDAGVDYEAMEGGGYLLRELQVCDKGPWLVIHGHKHFADIAYGRSTVSAAPTIFSAGSLSAKIYRPIDDKTSNQFYYINIDNRETAKIGKLVGEFETYEWKMGTGWQPSHSSQLPAKGGFGSTETPEVLAADIQASISSKNPFIDEQEIARYDPVLRHYTPQEFTILINQLKRHGLEVVLKHNKIVQIGLTHD